MNGEQKPPIVIGRARGQTNGSVYDRHLYTNHLTLAGLIVGLYTRTFLSIDEAFSFDAVEARTPAHVSTELVQSRARTAESGERDCARYADGTAPFQGAPVNKDRVRSGSRPIPENREGAV